MKGLSRIASSARSSFLRPMSRHDPSSADALRAPGARPEPRRGHRPVALLELVRMTRPTAPVAAASMLGSYIIASRVGSQSGALVAMIGPLGWCAATWRRDRGTSAAAVLTGVYLGAFALSHPLARRVGAWSSVLGATAVTGAATHAVADRSRSHA